MIAVEGTKFISEVEFDQAVEQLLPTIGDEYTERVPGVMGALLSMLVTCELARLRRQLFGKREDK